jgi:[ribosomal protein S18]-alanine N-acetyltransferase
MKIRLATKDNLRAIVAIQDKCPEASQWILRDYARLLDDSGGMILVAEMPTLDPPRVVGFAAFHRIIDETELFNMAVDPDFRRQGAGHTLLIEARERLMAAGAKRVYLEVRQSNKPAQALYYGVGFAIHSLRKDYYRDPPEDALVLGWELRPPTVTPNSW